MSELIVSGFGAIVVESDLELRLLSIWPRRLSSSLDTYNREMNNVRKNEEDSMA